MTLGLVRAEQALRTEVKDRLVAYAVALWGGLGSWRDPDVDRFVAQIVPRVLAGQVTVARLTDVYLAQVTGAGLAGALDVSDGLRGVDPTEVYRRPAVQMRTTLSRGGTFDTALSASLVRLVSLVSTDLQMVNVHQARRSLSSASTLAYRRTLTGNESCALCIIASTQWYRKSDLMPIHPGCDCGVEPVTSTTAEDQAQADERMLEVLHTQVEGFTGGFDRSGRDLGRGTGNDYRDLLVVHEHGEVGPVLGWRDQKFTGPHDLAA